MTRRPMGELEGAVMDALWERGGWLTPGEVHTALQQQGYELAYTTVMTVLVRLWQKERVQRQRDGRAYAYHPVITREQYVATRMEEVLEAARDRSAALGHFLEALDAADRVQLRRLLKGHQG